MPQHAEKRNRSSRTGQGTRPAKIETALAQQDNQLKELEALSQRARDAYLEVHHKADAMESMIDKLEEEHKLSISRAEQREADEWANRRR